MAAIAKPRGMKSTLLLTKKATRAHVLAAMRQAAKRLVSGDLSFLTYSGHGGQVPDVTGEETDKEDETWCLYDVQLIDDELYFD
jgi:metacaspase-1